MRSISFSSFSQLGGGFIALAGVSYTCMCTFMENFGYLAQADGESMRVFVFIFTKSFSFVYKILFILYSQP